MGYIDSNLTADERVVYRAQVHWIVFLGPILWFILGIVFFGQDNFKALGGLFIGFAVLHGIASSIVYLTSEFGVTTKRVLGKVGFIRRKSIEILLSKVESIEVDQGILGRLLDYGTIIVSGTGGSKTPFPKISAPLTCRKRIQTQLEASQAALEGGTEGRRPRTFPL